MSESIHTPRRSLTGVAVAGAVTVVALASATVGVAYIAGMFGLSWTFAAQVVDAVLVGGAVLAIVMGLLSGGIAGIVVATARWAIAQWGRKVAIA